MNFSNFSISSLIAYLGYYDLVLSSKLNESSRENINRFRSDCVRELERKRSIV